MGEGRLREREMDGSPGRGRGGWELGGETGAGQTVSLSLKENAW